MYLLCSLNSGAAIKLRDRLGRTPFNVAVESGNEACAELLYQVISDWGESDVLITAVITVDFSERFSISRQRSSNLTQPADRSQGITI